jgi:hypothetical protein
MQKSQLINAHRPLVPIAASVFLMNSARSIIANAILDMLVSIALTKMRQISR